MNPHLQYKDTPRPRIGFHASDFGTLEANIILSLQGVPPTNPKIWSDTLRLGAGKGVELAMLNILKENGIVEKDFDQEEIEPTVVVREGVTITSHLDATVRKGAPITLQVGDSIFPQHIEVTLEEGEPIEIKSINNKNSFDIAKYEMGQPRDNYVGQLAQYMDSLGKERGHLFVASIDGLHTFWLPCKHLGNGQYQCGETIVDLKAQQKRYAEIWQRKDSEPNWFEETYKLPLEKVDWRALSKTKIGDARNGRYVVGSENKWRIDYSPYKNLIVEKQGATLGYSEAEIAKVKELTDGFTTWFKKIKDEVPSEAISGNN
jgi:hypothetical protein